MSTTSTTSEILIDQLTGDDGLDTGAQGLVDIVVVTDLLDGLALFEP
jgi:hypothetical protein